MYNIWPNNGGETDARRSVGKTIAEMMVPHEWWMTRTYEAPRRLGLSWSPKSRVARISTGENGSVYFFRGSSAQSGFATSGSLN